MLKDYLIFSTFILLVLSAVITLVLIVALTAYAVDQLLGGYYWITCAIQLYIIYYLIKRYERYQNWRYVRFVASLQNIDDMCVRKRKRVG